MNENLINQNDLLSSEIENLRNELNTRSDLHLQEKKRLDYENIKLIEKKDIDQMEIERLKFELEKAMVSLANNANNEKKRNMKGFGENLGKENHYESLYKDLKKR